MPKIDEDTRRDIVELINTEMVKALCDGKVTDGPERLANLILGRLGHEVERKKGLPDLPEGEWEFKYISDTGHHTIIAGDKIIIGRAHRPGATPPNKKKLDNAYRLMEAAPKLAEAGYKLISYVYGLDGTLTWPIGTQAIEDAGIPELREALREAGVEI